MLTFDSYSSQNALLLAYSRHKNLGIYENIRGIYALLKLLHHEKAFAINCPALQKNNNKNKEKLIRS